MAKGKSNIKSIVIWLLVIGAILGGLYLAWIYFLKPLVAKLLGMLGFANLAGKLLSLPGKALALPGKAIGGLLRR